MNENLALNLVATARQRGDRPALRLDADALTYAGLDEASARMASVLRLRGLRPGDRVGIMLPNVPQFAVVYYGVLRAGGVVVPMNVLLKQREVAFHLADSEAGIVIAMHGTAEAAQAAGAEVGAECLVVEPGAFDRMLSGVDPTREVAGCAGEDTAVILYTSGTTGKPKGAELTHANLRRNVEAVVRLFSIEADETIIGALPLFHSFGQTCTLNAAVAAGASLALTARFDPGRVLELIDRRRVALFAGVPTMYAALLHHRDRADYDVSSLRLCVSGGAALPVELLRGFEEAFGCMILEGYGLSETSPVACFNHPDRRAHTAAGRGSGKPGSIGTPIAGVQMRVVDDARAEVAQGDVGEIAIRGHNVMKGYWRRPEATAEAIDADGWFYTGDMGRVDEDGCYFIVDRKKELIIRGGYNVYPREIEEVLYEHPAVLEAAVVGLPHPELGEEVGAAVALRAGAEVGERELRDYVKSQVAAYKYPRHVWFVDELPKGPTGKILKREIRAPVAIAGVTG
jgi:long-chain acyl-CoA synthetase